VRRGSSAYGDFFFSRRDCAVVISPGEFECAALFDFCVELHVRIGSNCRIKIHRKHRLAIELAGELVDDFARDRGNSVLISITSPFLASAGSLRRGFSAMVCSCSFRFPISRRSRR
jgi:hypothetical protein